MLEFGVNWKMTEIRETVAYVYKVKYELMKDQKVYQRHNCKIC